MSWNLRVNSWVALGISDEQYLNQPIGTLFDGLEPIIWLFMTRKAEHLKSQPHSLMEFDETETFMNLFDMNVWYHLIAYSMAYNFSFESKPIGWDTWP